MERWKPVVGYEGLYEVSDLGRVRRTSSGAMKALVSDSKTDHQFVHLWINGQGRHRFVHQLVLEAFVGPCPEGHESLHWDDDPANNCLSNLRWGTRSENVRDAVRNGRHNKSARTHCKLDHPLSGDNLYVNPSGSRECRTCRKASQRAYQEKRRAAHLC